MIWSLLLLSSTSFYNTIEGQFPVIREDRVIVDDAIRRWKEKASDGMGSRYPVVVYILNERCVILHVIIPSVGVSPVYCYKLGSDQITRWDDKLE